MLFEALGALTLAALMLGYAGALIGHHVGHRKGYARGRFDTELRLNPEISRLRGKVRTLMRFGPDAPWEDRPALAPRHARPEPRQDPAPVPAGAPRLVIVPAPMPNSGAYPVILGLPQPSGVSGDENTTTWKHDTGEFAAITAATYAAADETIAAIRDGAL